MSEIRILFLLFLKVLFIKMKTQNNQVLLNEESNMENDTYDQEILYDKLPCWKRYLGPIKSGSLRGSTIAMASITFGSGCLSFPNAISKCGPIVGLAIFITIAIASYYTLWSLLKDGLKSKFMDYNELMTNTLGATYVFFSDVMNLLLCLGSIMSYQITVYRFGLELLNLFFGIEINDTNRLYLQIACFIFIQIPINCLREISYLQYVSIVGTLSLIYSIIVIVAEFPLYLTQYLETNPFPSLFVEVNWGYFDTFAIFMFGFSSHNGIFQIFNEVARPSSKRYHKVLMRSFLIELVLYSAITFCGYFSTFSETKDIFLDRPDLKSFTPDYFIKAAKLTLFVCLHSTMAMNYNIMRMSYKTMIFNNSEISFIKDFALMVLTFLISNVTVLYVKRVTTILGTVGGICTVTICFVGPLLCRIVLSRRPHSHYKNILRWVFLIVMSIVGIISTYRSIQDAIDNP
jgi:amino acid permease